MSSAVTRPIKWRKHEFAARLRNYVPAGSHEAVISLSGSARALGTVLGYYWDKGVYWITVDYNGNIQDIPANNVRLLSTGY